MNDSMLHSPCCACSRVLCGVILCVCSSWKPELQLQLRRPFRQPPLPAAPSPHLQALFCVSRQVLGLPLWRQRLRGLQGNMSVFWSASQRALYKKENLFYAPVKRMILSEVLLLCEQSFCKCVSRSKKERKLTVSKYVHYI